MMASGDFFFNSLKGDGIMRACGLRSLSVLAATVLLSVSQFSPARADSIGFSSDPLNFGDVTVGTTKTIALTATFTVDPGFDFLFWIAPIVVSAPFSSGSCGSTSTCVVDVSFSPTTTGDFTDPAVFFGEEAGVVGFPPSFETPSLTSTLELEGVGVAAAPPAATPLPATLPLFATGLGALGLLGWRRKRKGGAGVALVAG